MRVASAARVLAGFSLRRLELGFPAKECEGNLKLEIEPFSRCLLTRLTQDCERVTDIS